MEKVLCTICLLALTGGCYSYGPDYNQPETESYVKSPDCYVERQEEKAQAPEKTQTPNYLAGKIIEVRKPAKKALENINLITTGKGPPMFVNAIDEKHIRIGPGMEYDSDDTGPLLENEKLYVLEEKNGWIRFRVTKKDLGWSAWVKKNLTNSLSSSSETPDYLTDTNLTELERLHQWVQGGLAEGVFHSVHVEYNEVRMDPVAWSFLPIEHKQTFVTCFSRYFDLRGSTGRVTILSKYSDEKLGSYSVWTGIKIYK